MWYHEHKMKQQDERIIFITFTLGFEYVILPQFVGKFYFVLFFFLFIFQF